VNVVDNLTAIKESIGHACEKAGRNPDDITLIAVTKYVTIERTEEALEAGITNVGENRNEGFLEKYETIGDEATWHFIGTLQSRKVKDIIDKVDVIHSVDRTSLAKEINKRAEKPVDCFIQVNVSGEESKHGVKPADVLSFVESLTSYPNVHIIGLMTMAPHVEDEDKLRVIFRRLRELRDEVRAQNFSHAPCTHLSMGMSNDYEIAIEEGATHIRIGTKLVGE